MGIAVYPPESTASARKWVLLSSVTPSASATLNFSSFAAYPVYRLVGHNVQFSQVSQLQLRINNDTTGSNYVYFALSQATTGGGAIIINTTQNTAAGAYYWDTEIIYADNVAPKRIRTLVAASGDNPNKGAPDNFAFYNSTSQVTSLNLLFINAATFLATGTVSLFGSNV
jgi:hypothetical protein